MALSVQSVERSHIALLQEKLVALQRRFPKIALQVPLDSTNFRNVKLSPIHGWLKYREGFSPQLVEFFIEKTKPANILDPFVAQAQL